MCLFQLGIVDSTTLQGLQKSQGVIQVDVVTLQKHLLVKFSGLQSPEDLGQDNLAGITGLLVTASPGALHGQATPIRLPT